MFDGVEFVMEIRRGSVDLVDWGQWVDRVIFEIVWNFSRGNIVCEFKSFRLTFQYIVGYLS